MLYDPKWETIKLEPWQEVLLKAADLIRVNGLAKHTRRDKEGGYCIHGAVSMAMAHDPSWDDENTESMMRRIVTHMRSRNIDTGYGYDWIAAPWNNQAERTKEEVIAVLEGAARAT